jgi:small-conductance mechanosensitive channel
MIIQTDEKSVTLTPFGSLALNGVANVSRDGGQSWIEIIRRRFLKLIKAVRTSRLAVRLHAWLSQPGS